MAWMAHNLFVRAERREALLSALEDRLADPVHQADVEGLVDDPPPPLTVGPECAGWVPVIGLAGWVADLEVFSRELSGVDGIERVVSSEVLGACYRLRHTDNVGGEQLAVERLPARGWELEARELRGPMPLYRDVEQLGYALLLDLGVPPAAALLGTPTEVTADRCPAVELGEGTALSWVDQRIARRSLLVRGPGHTGTDAPVFPRETTRGLHLFDDRFVEGEPTGQAVDRLIQIEDKILDRACRLYGLRGRTATLTMTYYNGCYQDELDALLRAREHHVVARPPRRPAVPWWQFWRYFGRRR